MRVRSKIVRALTLLVVCSSASAAFFSGNDLLQRLGDERRLLAMGYVAAIFDASWQRLQCAPASVSLAQVTNLVEFTLLNNPAQRAHSADVLVLATLQATWPCPSASRGSGKTAPL